MSTLSLHELSAHNDTPPPPTGWRAKAPTKELALLSLMADRRIHGPQDMERSGGKRFGARLHHLHKLGLIHYRRFVDPLDDCHVSYQQCRLEECCLCSVPHKLTLRERVAQLEAANLALREENGQLHAILEGDT